MGLPDKVPVNDLSRGWAATMPEVRVAAAEVISRGWYVHGPRHAAFGQQHIKCNQQVEVRCRHGGTIPAFDHDMASNARI